MKRKKISIRCYNRDQSWYFETVIQFNNGVKQFTLKVNIRRNAYDNQSCAKVYFWDGTKWNVIVDAPITECECKKISYVTNNVTTNDFTADSDRLLKEALQIVA
jgi:hypothetical protein